MFIYSAFVFLFSIIVTGFVWAETVYVTGVMKITMRTGPGVSHKIVAMVKSGDALEIIEKNDDWSRVKTPAGKEGWVLTRFITFTVPEIFLVNNLKDKNDVLSRNLGNIKAENARLLKAQSKLQGIEESFLRLKKESADFLDLEQKYKAATSQFKAQQKRIKALESSLKSQDIKWFLSGAGVLVAGILLGLSARKKKKNSLL